MPSKTFEYTGGWQKLEVPNKVTDFTISMRGGSSGATHGAKVTGLLRVNKDIDYIYIQVGEQGKPNNGHSGGGATYGGGGAGGSGSGPGGYSGGGASTIRLSSASGAIKAIAGGAGGQSGDFMALPAENSPYRDLNGRGGRGGDEHGEHGFPGPSAGTDPTGFGNAVGGSPTQGGRGGTNMHSSKYDGGDAANTNLARGGAGGSSSNSYTFGGGGGGGGLRAGGGGQVGTTRSNPPVPGGGGGGGSSYTLGLIGGQDTLGGGALGHGVVVISWTTPAPANQPPTPPTEIRLDGHAYVDDMPTMVASDIRIGASIDDPNRGDEIRLVVQLCRDSSFIAVRTLVGEWVSQTDSVKKNPDPAQKETSPVRTFVQVDGMISNNLYHARLYTQDKKGLYSTKYTAITFWTDRPPEAPQDASPKDGSQFDVDENLTFRWTPVDPDPNKDQRGFLLRWRVAPAVGQPDPTTWSTVVHKPENREPSWTVDRGTFSANTTYEWQVQTRDVTGKWGPFCDIQRFYVVGRSSPPKLIYPVRDQSVTVDQGVNFQWEYVDPRNSTHQVKADIRYRAVGSERWIPRDGTPDPGTPGTNWHWMVEPGALLPDVRYEWQARTYNTASSNSMSQWSESATFLSIPTPGIMLPEGGLLPQRDPVLAPPLGCGENRVYVYDRGGQRIVGEINPIEKLQWTRKRDDISSADITTNGFSWDCGQMLANLSCWIHEIVIFRDGVRVWEGPITRIGYYRDRVEIEAKDVMAYLYRRILRNGYNDAYQTVNGVAIGSRSVVDRASQIALDALAYDNPNVIEYMTTLSTERDAHESRIVYPFSRTAWEEIDDLAATAGLDYTVAGRRMIFWDTHEMIGLLPEMRDGDFSESPIVTEYGMNLCNFFAVTNGSGVYGTAEPEGTTKDSNGRPDGYGWMEQLASAYGESAGGAEATLTSQALQNLRDDLKRQAKKNIAHRWPTPLVVRVPDNSTLNPELNVGINQLIPGVWIPLRATGTLRPVSQMQKLDSITVTQDSAGEKVAVVMSPAPGGGDADPDADAAAAAAAEQG